MNTKRTRGSNVMVTIVDEKGNVIGRIPMLVQEIIAKKEEVLKILAER